LRSNFGSNQYIVEGPSRVLQSAPRSVHLAVVQSMADSVGSSSSPPIKKQKTANGELWQLAVTWMSGKTWQFEMSCTSTLGELRRRVMLASGS
jgi:hypothetical protein